MKNGRYRPHDDFFEIVAGRQTEILDALGIEWNRARPNQHIRCPYPGHEDKKPSWRWDPASGKAFCTCGTADITGVVMKMRGVDWKAARDYCREVLGAGPFQPQRRQPNDLALRSAVEPEPKQAKPEPAILQLLTNSGRRRHYSLNPQGMRSSIGATIFQPMTWGASIFIAVARFRSSSSNA